MEFSESSQRLTSLGLAPEGDSFLNRTIDSISHSKAIAVLLLFFCSQLILIIIMTLFTSTVTTDTLCFNALKPPLPVSKTRRFNFNFTGLHFFHEFLTLDLAFSNNNKSDSLPKEFNVSSYFISTMYLGKRLESRVEIPTKSAVVKFHKDGELSNKVRIFASNFIHFNEIQTNVFFKLAPSNLNFDGQFIWSYSDPSFAIVLAFLRFVFFILGICLFFRLLISHFDIKNSHAAIKCCLYLILLIIVCSDPLYILTYFTESNILKIIDTFFSNCFLFAALFSALFSLMLDDLTSRDVDFLYLFVKFLPYLFGFVVFCSGSIYSVIVTLKDPNSMNNDVLITFCFADLVMLIVYMLIVLIRGAKFQSDALNEKFVSFGMAILFIFFAVVVELIALYNRVANKAIYLMFCAIIYSLFFTYLNWPVDTLNSIGNVISENPDENEAVQEPLSAQLE